MIIQLRKLANSLFLCSLLIITACAVDTNPSTSLVNDTSIDSIEHVAVAPINPAIYHQVAQDVSAGEYFDFIDALVLHVDSITPYPIDEYVLMRANPWLIDSLAATDYYVTSARGQFIEDPKSIQILSKGDSLLIPSSDQVRFLREKMARTVIDVNIPEFKLRIKEGGLVIHEADVRVGKNTQRYLAMAKREVDLRTQPGVGEIVRIARDPAYINPRNNKRYSVTKRDDGKVTQLPRIPWLEPVIDGQRFGQLIHPTTNIGTLGKAYSNGCVGTSEADAWIIYFHAPLGTPVQYRYDLDIPTETGDTLQLKDIYPGFKKTKKKLPVYASIYTSFFNKLFSDEVVPADYCACDIE